MRKAMKYEMIPDADVKAIRDAQKSLTRIAKLLKRLYSREERARQVYLGYESYDTACCRKWADAYRARRHLEDEMRSLGIAEQPNADTREKAIRILLSMEVRKGGEQQCTQHCRKLT